MLQQLGLGPFLVEGSFFPENEQNDQERYHRSEKKTNAQNVFLKILERLVKERKGAERELLEKNGIILKAFLFSRTHSQLGTHFKSGMCFQFRFSLYVVNRN